MQATKITIGRLFNLGNYEHVRYELTVEVREGESAAHALRQTEAILETLNPRPSGVPKLSEIQRREEQLDHESKLCAADFERSVGHPVGGATAYIERVKEDIRKDKEKLSAWNAQKEAAREAFDNLGGQAIYKDAKLDWEDEYDNEP